MEAFGVVSAGERVPSTAIGSQRALAVRVYEHRELGGISMCSRLVIMENRNWWTTSSP